MLSLLLQDLHRESLQGRALRLPNLQGRPQGRQAGGEPGDESLSPPHLPWLRDSVICEIFLTDIIGSNEKD